MSKPLSRRDFIQTGVALGGCNEAHDLRERIESRQGLRQLSYMQELKMGSAHYRLIRV